MIILLSYVAAFGVSLLLWLLIIWAFLHADVVWVLVICLPLALCILALQAWREDW